MRSKLLPIFILVALLLSPILGLQDAQAVVTTDLVITGVIDGPLPLGLPKAVEFYVLNDIADLSIYGFGSANNGGGSDGEEFTFPSDAATAGSFIYVASEIPEFTNWFGFAPGYTSGAANINGDDAIELFQNGGVVDVFGDINVDGTGQPWEHLDGWAYRIDGTGPDGSTFVLTNWTFSGPNALDGETTNGTAATPFPTGTYSPGEVVTTDLVITGVIDGPLPLGLPKAVEFYVLNDIADLSIYGFGSANNGGGSDGEEFTFPSDAATAGSFIYVASEIPEFTNWFGFAPGYTSGAANINGDDAIELFQNGVVVDVFGDINVDGTGQPWEHLDGWAYRVDGTGPDGSTFVLTNWTFSGPNALDGETTNGTAATPFPTGTYSPGEVVTTDLVITGVIDGPLPLGLPKAVEFYVLNDIADLSIYGFGSANNGGGSDGEEFTFPSDAATAGSFIYVASEIPEFTNWFGFAPGYTSGAANINGDDAIELFQNGGVVDVFGDINVDGTGQPWEHLDGWAYRIDGTGPDGSTFVLTNWTFSGPNALDGETTNGTAATPFPTGTYSPGEVVTTDLVITGVIDGPLPLGLPKAVEFYVLNDIADLSIYGFGSANNGGGSDGEEFTFPSDAATAGSFIYVASEIPEFTNWFGFAPGYTSGAANINGDDAIELFQNGVVVDVFGDINVDGTGQPWEHLDGWAYRVDGTGPDGSTFVLANWTFSGPNALDGETTNGTAATPFPTSTYSPDVPVNDPVIVTCGSTLNVDQTYEEYRNVSATDADGIVNYMEITSITPSSDAITMGDVTPATEVGGEASATITVSAAVDAGTFTVEVMASNTDDEPQTGSCTLNVVVNPFLTIGEVQGVVEDSDSGTGHRSLYVAQTVVVQGVIYQNTQQKSGNDTFYGFHMQNTAATADGDPKSSDGIFVFQFRFNDILRAGGGAPYVPQVGDEIILRAGVTEFFNLTQLSSSPRLIEVVRSDVDLDAEVPAFETDPDDDLVDANRYWERREGMRAEVPAGSLVLNGRDVFSSSLDSEVWVMRGDHELSQRADPYTRRSFRDAHPLDNNPGELFDDGNGYRIIMGSLGLKAAQDDITALLAPSRTYDTLDNAPIGGVYYSFGKYQIQVAEQLQLTNGVDPALNAPPPAFDRQLEYSIVTFNVENLYDYYDDPFDGCDFHGNSGCPGVDPPFDYVPLSNDVYQARLTEIAEQIINDLHSPDIIMVQELEDQDVCYVDGSTYTCPAFNDQVNNADGKPDTLQELAVVIANNGGPVYDVALDRDGADDRGIISGYLFRSDRVELLPAQADDPVLGDNPTVEYDKPGAVPLPYNFDVQNPKVLNATLPDDVTGSTDGDNVFTRPPQVGFFRLWRDGIGTSVFTDMYISDNHFSSGPDRRVDQRTEQASYNAAIVAALQDANPEVYVTVGGDLNVYPRPDDPFPTPNESDQLAALYNQPMTNLWNPLVSEIPVSAYGYIFQGQTQTLDQLFVTPSWMTEFVEVRSAHINADFPADYPGDGPRGTSDHDPLAARYTLLPTLDRLEELVLYYDSMGEIYGKNTVKIMIDRLDRARRFEARGQVDAYMDQLYAFASQALDFAPDQMSQMAADALAYEALLLASQP